MVRAPKEFADAAAAWVPVRITDMADVDVNLLRFDFDLTMAVLLMNADGTVYHRYGSRDAHDALSFMSIPSLSRLLRDALADHRDYERAPSPPAAQPVQRAIDLPPLQRRLAQGQKIECVHCHTVHDALHQHAVDEHRFTASDKWIYPEPRRVGLVLDGDDQSRIAAVDDGSAAATAGLRTGDHLLRLGRQPRVRTFADASWALHQEGADGADVPVEFARGDAVQRATLHLAKGWKECPPEEYAWRPYKWNLSPAPGFGGPMLTAAEKKALSLPADGFAFRVQYLVDWGERSHRGKAAAAAGIRKGDVVVSFAGRSDFRSLDEWHAWIRLRCSAGQQVDVELLRDGQRRTIRYALPE